MTESGGTADPLYSHVPPGKYFVVFKSEELFTFHRQSRWSVVFSISDGPHLGVPVCFFIKVVVPRNGRLPRSAKMVMLYELLVRRRAPRRIHELRPSQLFDGCEIEVVIRSVYKDSKGHRRPADLAYSVVDEIIRITAGTPPALRGAARPTRGDRS